MTGHQTAKKHSDLKNALISAPVLRFLNFKEQFILTTDASNQGLGAVLSQNGHPCLFISRILNKAEERYSTSEKELLAIVWAMKRLRQYLLGKKFKIQTDYRALVWLHNVKDPSSRLLRWRLRMKEYEYEIEYFKGKENKVADCLSRLFPITTDTLKQAMTESRIPEEEDSQSETEELEELLPKIETSNTPIIIEDTKLTEENKIKLPNWRMKEPSEEPEDQSSPRRTQEPSESDSEKD